jgi:predicted TIM-barrel fold metal-dependent hydrolase
MPRRILDFHSHWGTQRGYVFRTPAELAHQERVWKKPVQYVSEQEMADYFKSQDVSAMLDFGFTKYLNVAESSVLHDYAVEVAKAYPKQILGNWLQIDPRTGAEGVAELRRVAERSPSLVGLCVSGAALGIAADDSLLDPFYKLSIEYRLPALILVGYTALGAGLPGGNGVLLDLCHPRYVDAVAAKYPELSIIAGRPAWPWQDDIIAVLLHKPNVWYELHGWSPKYYSDSLKREVGGRLQDRILFGADYPLLSYERLKADWKALGYSADVLEKVFCRNGERFLDLLRRAKRPFQQRRTYWALPATRCSK